jgi:mono/diheme cytochrome c family protein/plastocyanin
VIIAFFVVLVGAPIGLVRTLPGVNSADGETILIARMPEDGGWSQDQIDIPPGEVVKFRLTSEDVVHGFAIGKTGIGSSEILPGKWSEISWTPQEPGEYTFYCTRWCGPNHWRMTGTIRVEDPSGVNVEPNSDGPPLYQELGIDLDQRAFLTEFQQIQPSVSNGEELQLDRAPVFSISDQPMAMTPLQAWNELRHDPDLQAYSDQHLWDLTAYEWMKMFSNDRRAEGRILYESNCAACHGVDGEGDGDMAGYTTDPNPADFTRLDHMATASSALLQGKIIRGGMGTGMPYWGTIFTEAQTWSLVSYLWELTFQAKVE